MRTSIDEPPTSRLPRATASGARTARGVGYAVVAGGLLVVLLVGILLAVMLVSDDSTHPLVQPNPAPSLTPVPTPTPTQAAVPTPPPVTTTDLPVPVDTVAPPTDAFQPPQVTAEMITPPPPFPRRWWLHNLFPQLFPTG